MKTPVNVLVAIVTVLSLQAHAGPSNEIQEVNIQGTVLDQVGPHYLVQQDSERAPVVVEIAAQPASYDNVVAEKVGFTHCRPYSIGVYSGYYCPPAPYRWDPRLFERVCSQAEADLKQAGKGKNIKCQIDPLPSGSL